MMKRDRSMINHAIVSPLLGRSASVNDALNLTLRLETKLQNLEDPHTRELRSRPPSLTSVSQNCNLAWVSEWKIWAPKTVRVEYLEKNMA